MPCGKLAFSPVFPPKNESISSSSLRRSVSRRNPRSLRRISERSVSEKTMRRLSLGKDEWIGRRPRKVTKREYLGNNDNGSTPQICCGLGLCQSLIPSSLLLPMRFQNILG